MYISSNFNDNKKKLYHPAPLFGLSKLYYDPACVVDPPSRDVGDRESENTIIRHGQALAWDVVRPVLNKGVCNTNNECIEHEHLLGN